MNVDPKDMEWKAAHELVASLVVPRPIAWVSTIGDTGVANVAPFSFFTPVCTQPMLLAFSIGWKRDGSKKDTLLNVEFTKDFVVNIVPEALGKKMVQSSKRLPREVSEFKEAGLTAAKADLVKSPMVAESPVNMECRLQQIVVLGNAPRRSSLVIGEVLRVHIKDSLLVKGEVPPSKLTAIAQMGGETYCRSTDTFILERPDPLI